MRTNGTHSIPPIPNQQLRLFDIAEIDNYRFVDPLEGWTLSDVRALALDPEVEVRRTAALSNWNWDVNLQRVLGTDPDERVVLLLLSRTDPAIDVVRAILAGPHTEARRVLAARNLLTEVLLELIADDDPVVARSAARTLQHRGTALLMHGEHR